MKKLLTLLVLITACTTKENEEQAAHWIQLFNGKDLSNWEVKFAGHELGVNYKNTFLAEDGILKISYQQYDSFNNEFGHLFTKQSFSHYILRAEYRFVNDPLPNAPQWAFRNNGFMLHAQSAATMLKEQGFPVSLEAQPLGGRAKGERTTMNLCTPGTHVLLADSLHTDHCTNSTSRTYRGDQWVSVAMIVYGDSIIHHVVEEDTVLTYRKPTIGGEFLDQADSTLFAPGSPLTRGHIAIQAESHDTEFRKIELLDLSASKQKRSTP